MLKTSTSDLHAVVSKYQSPATRSTQSPVVADCTLCRDVEDCDWLPQNLDAFPDVREEVCEIIQLTFKNSQRDFPGRGSTAPWWLVGALQDRIFLRARADGRSINQPVVVTPSATRHTCRGRLSPLSLTDISLKI